MPDRPQSPTEWIDGFLFVGNHLALDFLNTKPILDDGPKEFLPDVRALERWLAASGLLASPKAKATVRRWRDSNEARALLREILAFRERLRTTIIRHEAGEAISDAFIAEVNRLLQAHPCRVVLRKAGAKFKRETVFEPQEPADVWSPIVAAVAELIADVPALRIRKCESCVVHFYDISKKGSRRWCSMNICGNKIKVAAYQARNRAAEK